MMSVTYFKLSLRNARRQAGDYLIYFATVIMAAALLYAFNGLVFSEEIAALSVRMKDVYMMIVLASIMVVGIFGWLVSYAANFMLTRRSRELGTYILIGLENDQVARLFFQENMAVGAGAFFTGLLLGGILYQILRAVVLTLYRQPYRFAVTFSLPAAGLTLVYFALIYLLALRKSRRRIRKMKICDLIYLERRNEEEVIRTGRKRRWVFTASLLLGMAGMVLLLSGNMQAGVIGAGCIILFLHGFFLSFASGVPAFFDRHPGLKYRGQNLLIFRTLTARLAAMGTLMATLSLLFTATLTAFGAGMMFHGLFEGRTVENTCFDLFVGMEGGDRDPASYLDYVRENIPVEESLLYRVYETEEGQVKEYLSGPAYYSAFYQGDTVLRYSDYAALRSVAGYPPVESGEGEYLIHCTNYVRGLLEGYERPLTLGPYSLDFGGIYTEYFSQSYSVANGRGYILVVPDEAAAGLAVHHLAYAARTAQPVSREQFYDLTVIADEHGAATDYQGHDQVISKADQIEEVAWSTVMLVFPLCFLALALAMTAAAILTIQQLSESGRYRRQFELLRRLGMERREMSAALRKQFTVYYAMPAVPPVLIGVPFILHLAKAPEPGVMVGINSPAAITGIALGMFFLIYGIYIVLAYTGLKKNVLPRGL